MFLVFRIDTREFFHGFDEDGVAQWHPSKAEVFMSVAATLEAMGVNESCRRVVIPT